jgi:hypothetical protein
MSQKDKSFSPQRDLSPKRQSKSPEIVQQSEISFENTVVKWLGEHARRPLVIDHLYNARLHWENFEEPIRAYIAENFPFAKKPFPYFAVILYFVDRCSQRRGKVYGKYELAVLLSRIMGRYKGEKARRFCEKVELHIGRLGLARLPFWHQFNSRSLEASSWADICEANDQQPKCYIITDAVRNFVTSSPFDDRGDGRVPHVVIGGVYDRLLSDCADAIEFEAIEKKHVDAYNKKIANPIRDRQLFEKIQENIIVHSAGRLRARALRAEIEDFVAQRLPDLVPYYEVALPTFSGKSRIFESILELPDVKEYPCIELIPEKHMIREKQQE